MHATYEAVADPERELARRFARPKRVGIVCDFAEEGWPSMDLAAELLALALQRHTDGRFQPVILRPGLPRLLRRLGPSAKLAQNGDRYVGRYVAYPRWLKRLRDSYDVYHVVDHSYAHLVHVLPAERTVVTCHDLDAFRSLLRPGEEPRPPWFRRTMKRVLTGLRGAAHVCCDADAVRAELVSRQIVRAPSASTVPLPVHPDFSPRSDREADADAEKLLGSRVSVELLHVGSTVERKRIDQLLRIFAAVLGMHPSARLVRAGGPLTPEQRDLAAELGVAGAITELPFLSRRVLAAVYRRASVVLVPSEREGFGLPLVEAMACGTPVVASDLPVFREVGGEAVVYRSAEDVEGWAQTIDTILWDQRDARERAGRRDAALDRAAAFSLEEYAHAVTAIYRRLLRFPGA